MSYYDKSGRQRFRVRKKTPKQPQQRVARSTAPKERKPVEVIVLKSRASKRQREMRLDQLLKRRLGDASWQEFNPDDAA